VGREVALKLQTVLNMKHCINIIKRTVKLEGKL